MHPSVFISYCSCNAALNGWLDLINWLPARRPDHPPSIGGMSSDGVSNRQWEIRAHVGPATGGQVDLFRNNLSEQSFILIFCWGEAPSGSLSSVVADGLFWCFEDNLPSCCSSDGLRAHGGNRGSFFAEEASSPYVGSEHSDRDHSMLWRLMRRSEGGKGSDGYRAFSGHWRSAKKNNGVKLSEKIGSIIFEPWLSVFSGWDDQLIQNPFDLFVSDCDRSGHLSKTDFFPCFEYENRNAGEERILSERKLFDPTIPVSSNPDEFDRKLLLSTRMSNFIGVGVSNMNYNSVNNSLLNLREYCDSLEPSRSYFTHPTARYSVRHKSDEASELCGDLIKLMDSYVDIIECSDRFDHDGPDFDFIKLTKFPDRIKASITLFAVTATDHEKTKLFSDLSYSLMKVDKEIRLLSERITQGLLNNLFFARVKDDRTKVIFSQSCYMMGDIGSNEFSGIDECGEPEKRDFILSELAFDFRESVSFLEDSESWYSGDNNSSVMSAIEEAYSYPPSFRLYTQETHGGLRNFNANMLQFHYVRKKRETRLFPAGHSAQVIQFKCYLKDGQAPCEDDADKSMC